MLLVGVVLCLLNCATCAHLRVLTKRQDLSVECDRLLPQRLQSMAPQRVMTELSITMCCGAEFRCQTLNIQQHKQPAQPLWLAQHLDTDK